jgi:hypothetical protein
LPGGENGLKSKDNYAQEVFCFEFLKNNEAIDKKLKIEMYAHFANTSSDLNYITMEYQNGEDLFKY